MDKFAHVISWVFMPLLMPIYALILVMFVPSNQDYFFNQDCVYLLPPETKTALLYMFLIFCVAAPGVSFIMLQRRKIISSIEMSETKERTIPIIVMFIYCLMLYILFVVKSGPGFLPKFIYALPLSGVSVTFIYFFLNRWKKISIHAGAAGILSGFVLAYVMQQIEFQLWVLLFAILVSGVVMSARLFLKKHTLDEIVIGWLVGCIITFFLNYYY